VNKFETHEISVWQGSHFQAIGKYTVRQQEVEGREGETEREKEQKRNRESVRTSWVMAESGARDKSTDMALCMRGRVQWGKSLRQEKSQQIWSRVRTGELGW